MERARRNAGYGPDCGVLPSKRMKARSNIPYLKLKDAMLKEEAFFCPVKQE